MGIEVKARQAVERAIVKQCIQDMLAADLAISVNDGAYENGETVLKKSRNAEAILSAMFSTDEDTLVLHHESGKRVGWIVFVYGNDGWDVISDNTMNLEQLLQGTSDLADNLSGIVISVM